MDQNGKTLTLTNELLDDIEMAMEDSSFDNEWYLDIRKNNVTVVSDYEDAEENEDVSGLIENDTGRRFLSIPRRFSSEGWNKMEQFILSLNELDEEKRDLLLNAIQGRGAFRRFDDAVYDLGFRDQWFEFRDRENRKEILDWLRLNDLITDDDVGKGMQLYEEILAKRKQRQEDIANMKKGTRVKCTFADGYAGQITVGKVYAVLDEQKENLNIRIRDDRENMRWYPKGNFELLLDHT